MSLICWQFPKLKVTFLCNTPGFPFITVFFNTRPVLCFKCLFWWAKPQRAKERKGYNELGKDKQQKADPPTMMESQERWQWHWSPAWAYSRWDSEVGDGEEGSALSQQFHSLAVSRFLRLPFWYFSHCIPIAWPENQIFYTQKCPCWSILGAPNKSVGRPRGFNLMAVSQKKISK